MNPVIDTSPFLPLDSCFVSLNDTISKTIQQITKFDEYVAQLNNHLNRINSRFDTIYHVNTSFSSNTSSVSQDSIKDQEKEKDASLYDKVKRYTETAESIGEAADAGLKLLSAYKKESAILREVSTGVEVFNNGLKVFSGIEALAVLTENLATVGSLLAGAETAASVLAFLGPEGITAGALLVGGAAVVTLSENMLLKNDIKENTFSTEARSNRNQYLLNNEFTDRIAEDYLHPRIAKKNKSVTQISHEVAALKAQFLKQRVIRFDWERAEKNDPVYLQALVAALNANELSKNKSIKQVVFGDSLDKQTFGEHFDKFNHFPLTVASPIAHTSLIREGHFGDGPTQFKYITTRISQKEFEEQKKEAIKHRVDPLKLINDAVLKTTVQSYLNNGFAYVQKEYRDNLSKYPKEEKQINNLWQEFLRVKQRIDNDKELEKSGNATVVSDQLHAGRSYAANSKRSVVINVNKPMIENFTINAADAKTGINDFKHKVEEVLLEILNSANVVQ